jgi:hypothetical protein
MSFHVLMPDKKGSEQWVYSMIQKDIESLPGFQGVITKYIKDCRNILLVDDFTCTGHNLCGTIDNFLYQQSHDVREVIIGVPYFSQRGMENIRGFLATTAIQKCVRAAGEIIPPFQPIQKLSINKLMELGINSVDACGFYTQWKIPGNCSGLPSIILRGIVPGKPDFGPIVCQVPTRIY